MSHEPKAGMNLGPEMLAAYIDNRLPPDQRAAVEAQLATDPDSYAVLVETIKALDAIEGTKVPEVPSVPRVRRWAIASAVLAAAAALVLLVRLEPDVWQRIRGERVDPQIERLVAAVGNERYIDARLSGGFKYGPLVSATRGPGELATQNLALLSAAGEAQRIAAADPSASNLNAWGIAQVLLGEYDGAITTLEQASRAEGASARIQCDLAAAYLTRAKAFDRPDDVPRALAAAERALGADSSLEEALHNKALALEALVLNDQALEIWRRLEQQGRAEWSAEATRHIQQLQRPRSSADRWRDLLAQPAATFDHAAVRGLEHEARNWIRTEGAAAVIEGVLRDRAPADQVARIRAVATALADADRFDLDWLQRALGDVDARGREAELALRFGRLMAASGSFAMTDLLPEARLLHASLVDSGHPLEGWSCFLLAESLRLARDLPAMRTLLITGRSIAAASGYHTLTARIAWLEGTQLSSERKHAEAIPKFDEAREQFIAAHDAVGEGRLWSQLSSTLHLIGNDRDGWRARIAALRIAVNSGDRILAEVACNGAASISNERDYPEVGVAFLTAQSGGTFAVYDAIGFAQTNLRLAQAYAALARFGDARRALDTATGWMERIEQPRVRSNADSLASRIEANLTLREGRQQDAYRLASDGLHRGMRDQLEEASMLIIRAASAPTSEFEPARHDLESALDRLDAFYRSPDALGVPDSDRQNAIDAGRRVIGGLLDAGDPERAVMLADRLTTATGLWRARANAPTPTKLPVIPRGTAVVEYFPAETDTLVWVISSDSLHALVLPVSSARISAIAAVVRVAAERKDVIRFRRLCAELYRALVDPIAAELDGQARLVFVAPGALQGVPFAALAADDAGPLLFERFEIALAPSLRMLATPGAARKQPRTFSLAVGSAGGSALWKRLSGVAAELRLLRQDAVPDVVLEGTGATVERVAAQLADRPALFHYAGHAFIDFARPGDSAFVLSDGRANGYAYLTIGELLRRDLRAPSIVLLSACATGQQASRQLEASGGMAAAFLSMGATAAVATLWDLDDRAAPALFVSIHQQVRAGRNVSAALREAQLSEKRTRDAAAFPEYLGVVAYLSTT